MHSSTTAERQTTEASGRYITRRTFYSPFRKPWFTPLRKVLEETRAEAERFINGEVGSGDLVSVSENAVKGRFFVTVWFREPLREPKKPANSFDDLD